MDTIKQKLFNAIFLYQDKDKVKAILIKKPHLVNETIESYKDSEFKNNGYTPLLSALAYSDNEMFEMILNQFNADPDKGDNEGTTALFKLSSTHKEDKKILVNMLLEKGADVNKGTNTGKTPLMLAAQYGYLYMVQKLLDHKANANAKDENNTNALRWMGLYQGDQHEKLIDEIVRLLVESGADIHNVDNFGRTPLMTAQKYNEFLVEKALLRYGAT